MAARSPCGNRPLNEVERAIGTLEEAPDLDLGVSCDREVNKDVAAMTLLGGVS